MKTAERQTRQLKEAMHITADRGETWTGIRPATFRNRKHKTRAELKQEAEREIDDYAG